MKVFKIGIASALIVGLCSFALYTSSSSELPIDQKLYKKFIKSFNLVELPYSMEFKKPKHAKEIEDYFGWDSEKSVFDKSNEAHLGYEFSEFVPAIGRGYMSRMGPDDFFANDMVAQNDKFTAVIYSRSPNYDSGSRSFILATFTNKGDMISERTIGYASQDYYEEPSISKDFKIKIKHLEADVKENAKQSIEYNIVREEKMHIDASTGEIVAHTDVEKIQQKQEKLELLLDDEIWNN